MNRQLRTIAEEECARIRPLLARHEEEERDNRADLPRRVSFDDSAEGERVHRYQAHWSRMLFRTLAELRNHREPEARPDADAGAVPPSPSVDLPAPEREAAVPSFSGSSPQPVLEVPHPVEAPAAPPAAEAMLRNKPTADESTSETTGSYVENPGESKPTPSGAQSTVRVSAARARVAVARALRAIASRAKAPRRESDSAASDEARCETAAEHLHPVPFVETGVSSLSPS